VYITLNRTDDHDTLGLGLAVGSEQRGLEYIHRSLHRFGAECQLGQKVLTLLEQHARLADADGKTLLDCLEYVVAFLHNPRGERTGERFVALQHRCFALLQKVAHRAYPGHKYTRSNRVTSLLVFAFLLEWVRC